MALPVVVGSRVSTIYLPTDSPVETRTGSVTVLGSEVSNGNGNSYGWIAFAVQLDDIGDGGYRTVCFAQERGIKWEMNEDLLTRSTLIAAYLLHASSQ
jgi:hypothetical protein